MKDNRQFSAGLGATLGADGTTFRVWAPNADAVFVTGDFNEWSEDATPMEGEDDGYWRADVQGAGAGSEYRYRIVRGEEAVSRIDPYARAVTNSVGNAIVHDPAFDWGEDASPMPDWNRLVIYELHIGTFNREEDDAIGSFGDAIAKFDQLKRLGINAIQIMPVQEFAGDLSWGYNPAHIFAVETAYGGPDALKSFVREAHSQGFAVILDVVYNHFGPSDLDLWQFDGWSENDKGGIYFYQDHRSDTPWGDTRPDYGRDEVRGLIRDNALYWLEEFHIDGLRFDMTLYIRTITGDEGSEDDALPEGWSLMQWLNDEIATAHPGRITIAEDLREKDAITAPTGDGGAGFGAQWDAAFVHPVRAVLTAEEDHDRDMSAIEGALTHSYNGDAFSRVIYTESHDEVANGRARVPHEIDGEGHAGWAAQKLSTLGAALVMTAPGIPMMFQGQEFLQGGWFDDSVPLDWDLSEEFRGIARLWRDLIALRLDRAGDAGGLAGHGVEIVHLDHEGKTIAYLRRAEGAEGEVLVVMNFAAQAREGLTVGLPEGGQWRLRLNTDWEGYSPDFGNHAAADLEVQEGEHDGRPYHAGLSIGGYTALIYTR
ncbi:alpha-amylase family glycosyl hydrolase [Palleronia sp. LCG004]|uniref:alpha-amylase family glycosyl hydrolase n=1 Tax=Palleronia sp. LCG004 TaxID=3079304 RepID=UPI002941DF3C|nr:alpha-amylase family glycosyl hydrolase [Palleronia sp. LCG004]WOI57981.1 alpha-amylase family glycosyl hydrolase [Palleronia sp. LCG004]